jgi:hypothetical protein
LGFRVKKKKEGGFGDLRGDYTLEVLLGVQVFSSPWVSGFRV